VTTTKTETTTETIHNNNSNNNNSNNNNKSSSNYNNNNSHDTIQITQKMASVTFLPTTKENDNLKEEKKASDLFTTVNDNNDDNNPNSKAHHEQEQQEYHQKLKIPGILVTDTTHQMVQRRRSKKHSSQHQPQQHVSRQNLIQNQIQNQFNNCNNNNQDMDNIDHTTHSHSHSQSHSQNQSHNKQALLQQPSISNDSSTNKSLNNNPVQNGNPHNTNAIINTSSTTTTNTNTKTNTKTILKRTNKPKKAKKKTNIRATTNDHNIMDTTNSLNQNQITQHHTNHQEKLNKNLPSQHESVTNNTNSKINTSADDIGDLPARELTITSNTVTYVRRTDSSTSLLSKISEKSATEHDAVAGTSGHINLLRHDQNHLSATNTNTDTTTTDTTTTDTTAIKKNILNQKSHDSNKAKHEKKDKKSKKGKQKNKNHRDNHHTDTKASNQRAAYSFNKSVRLCVEDSNPDGIYTLLHNKKNHKFALQADVLETVMKAYIVAAMFEDALYCLRHCSLPGTLNTSQTEKILLCLPQNLRNSSAYVAAEMINALCIATEFDKPTHRTYFLRVVRSIALEFLEEATSARDRICSAPCERLVRSAVCVVNARLCRGKKVTELIVKPGDQLGVFVPDTLENRGIQAGDAVGILPYGGPYPMSAESLDRNMIEATVTGVQPMVLRLQDKTNAALHSMLTESVEGNIYRIDKLANRMGFNRQLSAAVAVASPLEKDINGITVPHRRDSRRPSPELIKAITAMDENIDKVMGKNFGVVNNSISNKGNSNENNTATICAQPVPWSVVDEDTNEIDPYYEKNDSCCYDEDALRDAAQLALEKYGALEGLNASQRLAVEGAATNRLTLVQGPPGTGKTAVAIRILQHWARLASSEANRGENPKPILATSDSNIAVDNLVEGCASVGLRVIRLGRPEAIRPELLKHCIDKPQINSRNEKAGYNNHMMQNHSSLNVYKEKMKNLKNAQVICCTCIGSGSDILDNLSFERVLVDEATQATEPAVLVPLTRACRQLVLVGDHCQLPPTVLSTRAEEEGLGVPLFSRMVACGVPPFMLDTQYRMHPAISMFPSDLFYGGKLLNGVSPPERRPLAGFPWPREEFPVAFVPVPHGIEVDDGVSKLNEAEAAAACDAVSALLDGGQCTPADIAVVTPYSAQVRLIRRLTRKLVRQPPYVEVSSTDGFQGREKEAVVFSAVRSNDYGAVGFVSDWRRVNVSFTRARRALIVIGNDMTLRRGDPDTWLPWLAWADAHGINMDKPGVPRGRYDAEQMQRVRGGTTAAEMLKDVLERQQAQLKTAEKQLQKAEKKSSGHIMGGSDQLSNGINGNLVSLQNNNNGVTGQDTVGAKSIEQDLALLSNTDGCWDDSEDEEQPEMQHSVSRQTLTTVSSSNTCQKEENEPQDAWDL